MNINKMVGAIVGKVCWHFPYTDREVRRFEKDVLQYLEEELCDVEQEEARAEIFSSILKHTADELGKPSSGENSSWADIPKQVKRLVRMEVAIKNYLNCSLVQKGEQCFQCRGELDSALKEQTDGLV